MELKNYIKKSGKPVTVWAVDNDFSPSTISRYLRGIGRLSTNVAIRIEAACNEEVTLKDLFQRYK